MAFQDSSCVHAMTVAEGWLTRWEVVMVLDPEALPAAVLAASDGEAGFQTGHSCAILAHVGRCLAQRALRQVLALGGLRNTSMDGRSGTGTRANGGTSGE